jgi:hypothetical protein
MEKRGKKGRPDDPARVTSSAFLSLLSLSFAELRKDIDQLLGADWPEPARRRAHELATTLWEACRRQGLDEIAGQARALASLAGLSHEKAAPLRPALREKFDELLRTSQALVSKLARCRTG